MKKMVYWMLGLSVFSFSALGLDYLYYTNSCRFSPGNLNTALHSEIVARAEEQNIDKNVFAQEYHVLGEGRQCFAFVSADDAYVIKFFKKQRINKKRWAKHGNIFRKIHEKRHNTASRWKKLLLETAECYQLARQDLSDETGVIYTHFNKTEHFIKPLLIKDGKKTHLVDLNNTSFIVQRKVELTRDRISKLLNEGKKDLAVDALIQMRDLMLSRTSKGITDPRQSYGKNFGFIKQSAVQLDVGKISKDPSLALNPNAEMEKLTANLKRWVKKNYPDLYAEFLLKISDSSS